MSYETKTPTRTIMLLGGAILFLALAIIVFVTAVRYWARLTIDAQVKDHKEQQDQEWVLVGEWEGSGPKTTERFESENGELSIVWAASPTRESSGYVGVQAVGPTRSLVANRGVDSNVGDSTYIHGKAGSYHLEIKATNVNWIVEVRDLR